MALGGRSARSFAEIWSGGKRGGFNCQLEKYFLRSSRFLIITQVKGVLILQLEQGYRPLALINLIFS